MTLDLAVDSQMSNQRKKIDKSDFFKLKKNDFALQQTLERQPKERDKIFSNHISDNRIYLEYLKHL